jgi:hypothetical protein
MPEVAVYSRRLSEIDLIPRRTLLPHSVFLLRLWACYVLFVSTYLVFYDSKPRAGPFPRSSLLGRIFGPEPGRSPRCAAIKGPELSLYLSTVCRRYDQRWLRISLICLATMSTAWKSSTRMYRRTDRPSPSRQPAAYSCSRHWLWQRSLARRCGQKPGGVMQLRLFCSQ